MIKLENLNTIDFLTTFEEKVDTASVLSESENLIRH